MTLLEFLAGAAPTWLVSSRQLARGRSRDRPAVSARGTRRGRVAGARLRRLRLLFLLCLLCRSDGHAEDGLGDATGDPRFHLFEEAVSLALVGDKRILLTVAA